MRTKRRSGLTLIEVVASLALLATAVCGILIAHGRVITEWGTIRERHTATALATELVTPWKLDRSSSRTAKEGVCESHADWSWVKSRKPYSAATQLALKEVTLTLTHTGAIGEPATYSWIWLEREHEP